MLITTLAPAPGTDVRSRVHGNNNNTTQRKAEKQSHLSSQTRTLNSEQMTQHTSSNDAPPPRVSC